jgi:hypothetical protein
MSLNQSISQLAPGLGILLGGAIASLASARVALAVAGGGSLVFSIVAAIALRPEVMGGGSPPPASMPQPADPIVREEASAAATSGDRSAV